jgi:hypothetical protein
VATSRFEINKQRKESRRRAGRDDIFGHRRDAVRVQPADSASGVSERSAVAAHGEIHLTAGHATSPCLVARKRTVWSVIVPGAGSAARSDRAIRRGIPARPRPAAA